MIRVAIWREQSLEQIIGGPLELESLSEASIRAVVEAVPAESGLVEFKAAGAFDSHPRTAKQAGGWTQQHERSKDIAALANGTGGLIIFGVTDAATGSDVAGRLSPLDRPDITRDIEQYRKDIRTCTSPIPLFDMFEIPAAERGSYIVAVVPPSALVPHAVKTGTKDKPALVFPVRAVGEAQTRFLTEAELADMYARRIRSAADRTRRANALWDTSSRTLRDRGGHGVWAVVCVSPDAPVDDTLSVSARREITAWNNRRSFPDGMIGIHAHSLDYPFPGPGFVEYTQLVATHLGTQKQVAEPGATSAYRALYADGSGIAAIKVGDETTTDYLALTLDEIIDALTTCIPHLLDWVGDRCGTWGPATMTTSLVDVDTDANSFSKPVRLQPGDTHSFVHALRQAHRPNPRVQAIDLSTTTTMQDRLAHTYQAAAAQLQMFGLIEPDLLAPDGRVRTVGFDGRHRHHVQDWCQRHNVPMDAQTWPDSVRES